MVEGLRARDALVRGRQLGVADYAHALGSLAALVVVVGVAATTLSALLHSQGDNGQRVAVAISDLVLSPLLFLGAALLYLDQAARVGSVASDRRRRRDAHFHPPVDADAAGRHDAQVEP
jgi:ABC-type Na+ efflux pump permease subunit